MANPIWDNASTLLTAADAVLVAGGVTPPDRQYIQVGQVAWDCVAEGSMIWTINGPLPIEEVQPGDEVWSWVDGELARRRVLARHDKGLQDVIAVSTRHRTLRVTADHRVLMASSTGRRRADSAWYRTPNLSWAPSWTEASAIPEGEFLVGLRELPDHGGEVFLPDGTRLDLDVAWLLGLMVGDGTVTRYGFNCCVFGAIRGRAMEIIERVWGYEAGENPHNGLWVYGPAMRDLFTQLGLQHKSPDRSVPQVIWSAPKKAQRAFLDGYRDADGHTTRKGYITYAATSKRLVEQVRMLHIGVGDQVSNRSKQERKSLPIINGKQVKTARPLWGFSVFPNDLKGHQFLRDAAPAVYGQDFRPERVSSVVSDGKARVWDLTIEGAHNFIADGLVVHNCEQLVVEVAGVRSGPADIPIGPEITKAGRVLQRAVDYRLWLVRDCQPTISGMATFPSPGDLNDAAELMAEDGWLLFHGLRQRNAAGTLFDQCNSPAAIGPLNPVGPSGTFVGWTLLVSVGV